MRRRGTVAPARTRWDLSRGRTGPQCPPRPRLSRLSTPGPPGPRPEVKALSAACERHRSAGDQRQPGDQRRHRNHQRRARSWLADRWPWCSRLHAMARPAGGARRVSHAQCTGDLRPSGYQQRRQAQLRGVPPSAVAPFAAVPGRANGRLEATLRRWNADHFHEKWNQFRGRFGHPQTWAWDPWAAIPTWAWDPDGRPSRHGHGTDGRSSRHGHGTDGRSSRHGHGTDGVRIPAWAWDRWAVIPRMGMGPMGSASRYGHGTDGSASRHGYGTDGLRIPAWAWDRWVVIPILWAWDRWVRNIL